MDNHVNSEIDWVNAYYSMVGIWDATFSFWLTSTFAVIVAVHVLGIGISTKLRWLILVLYSLFSALILSRYMVIAEQSQNIGLRLTELGIVLPPEDYFGSSEFFSDTLLFLLFWVGSIGTAVFVYTSGKRNERSI